MALELIFLFCFGGIIISATGLSYISFPMNSAVASAASYATFLDTLLKGSRPALVVVSNNSSSLPTC